MRNTLNSEGTGIVQSDVVLKGAVVAAINALRADAWLLDYCFANLPKDDLTAGEYGDLEVERAKEWFLHTKIYVVPADRLDPAKLPCVSYQLDSSTEVAEESTLGDVHYQPVEFSDWSDPALAGPLTPVGYDAKTGELDFDPASLGGLVLGPGMVVATAKGRSYQSTGADEASLTIAPGLVADFDGCTIHGSPPDWALALESGSFRETWTLGCHVAGEPVHLAYLHSILIFALRRYGETFLEARGFERSVVSSGRFEVDEQGDQGNWYDRAVQITGYVRQVWPKAKQQVVQSVELALDAGLPDSDAELVPIVAADGAPALPPPIQPPPRTTAAVYWGAAAQPGSITAAFVKGLGFGTLEPGRQATYGFSAGSTQYCWIAWPAAYGGVPGDFTDQETGFPASFSLQTTLLVDGTPYAVWRSAQPGLGVLGVVVF